MNIAHLHLKWNYKKWRIEKDFQTEILWYLRKLWYIAYKIADIWLNAKFLDSFYIDEYWICRFIEFKKIEKDTFNVSQFENNQIILLRELDKRNMDTAKVYIYSVKNNDYKVYNFSELWNMKNEKWWCKLFNNKK